jgi:hypothetical protein
MLKDILKLEGAQELSKSEQKKVSGGICFAPTACGEGWVWSIEQCSCVCNGSIVCGPPGGGGSCICSENNIYEDPTF